MIMRIYSVRDNCIAAFLQPFFARSDAEAARSFSDACTSPDHNFSKHLPDYSLYVLGEFDDTNGACLGMASPVKVVDGLVYEVRSLPTEGIR